MSKLRALSAVGLAVVSIFASTAAFAGGYSHGHHRQCFVIYWNYDYHLVCR